jgi:hypothetical protein
LRGAIAPQIIQVLLSGAQFERFGLLGTRHVEGVLKTGMCFGVVVWRLLQQQRAFEAIELGLVQAFASFVYKRQRFCEYRETCFSTGMRAALPSPRA